MIILQFKTTNSLSRTISVWKNADNHNHRLGGKPAQQIWYSDGQKRCEEYYEHNQLHRLNGKPALQAWYPNGRKIYERYCQHGKMEHEVYC